MSLGEGLATMIDNAPAPLKPAYMVIGPSGAGKTSLLCSLKHASMHWRRSQAGAKSVKVKPLSKEAGVLFEAGREAILKGGVLRDGITGTDKAGEVKFGLQVSRGFLRKDVDLTFSVFDTPGGDFTSDGGSASQERKQYLTMLQMALGAIICIDVSARAQTASAVSSRLPRLISEIVSGLEDASVRYARTVIVLCKCDRMTDAGNSPVFEQDLAQIDPVVEAAKAMTPDALQTLLDYIPSTGRVAFGWASAYGYVTGTGEPNYVADSQAIKTFQVGRDQFETDVTWAPFRVLEPFVYLATGKRCHLKEMRGGASVMARLEREGIADGYGA